MLSLPDQMAQQNPQNLNFNQALELFDLLPMIAIDTETNALDVRDGRGFATGVSISARIPGVGIRSTYLPYRHPNSGGELGENLDRDSLFKLKDKIENYAGYLVFHNAKFDLESLATLGINYTGKFYCTMLFCHLLNENLPYEKNLNNCCKKYGVGESKKESVEFQTFKKLYGWAQIPPMLMFEYGAADAAITYQLMENLLPLIDEQLMEYWHIQKMPFINVIRTMERIGVRINVELCNRMALHGEICMDEIVELLDGLNPGSPKDLNKLLLDQLSLPVVKRSKKTDKPSFDKEAMAEYETMLELRDDPTAEYILAYRGWQKSVSSNYRPYMELLSPDGRLRPNYKLHGTKTGRMSCEKPNLQQIPRSGSKAWNGEMKSAFIPHEGYFLWEADYSQLELRLGTAYAEQENDESTGLKRVFAEGRDIFTEMSKTIGLARHDTKTLVYTTQYGGGIKRLVTVFGITAARAQEIRENYFTAYPGFRVMPNLAQKKAAVAGKVQLWSGRYRHFLYPQDEAHKAFNSIIQGGAADIVERAMIRLFYEVHNPDECRMLLQVHDSVVWEIKQGLEDKYMPKIIAIMEDVQPDFGVKFAVDAHKWGTEDKWTLTKS